MLSKQRILGLLDEISSELRKVQVKISKGNPDLVGVLDHLLSLVDAQRMELNKKGFSYENFSALMKLLVSIIETISRLTGTLYYKICRYAATINRGYRICQWERASSCLGSTQT